MYLLFRSTVQFSSSIKHTLDILSFTTRQVLVTFLYSSPLYIYLGTNSALFKHFCVFLASWWNHTELPAAGFQQVNVVLKLCLLHCAFLITLTTANQVTAQFVELFVSIKANHQQLTTTATEYFCVVVSWYSNCMCTFPITYI